MFVPAIPRPQNAPEHLSRTTSANRRRNRCPKRSLAPRCRLPSLAAVRFRRPTVAVDEPLGNAAREHGAGEGDAGAEVMGTQLKSTAGRHAIPIAEATVPALLRQQAAQDQRRAALQPHWKDDDLVFGRGDGSLLSRGQTRLRLDAAIMEAGVPCLTPHGLRRTCFTVMALAGVPAKVISHRAGIARRRSHWLCMCTPMKRRDALSRMCWRA